MSNYRELTLQLAQLPQPEFDRVLKNLQLVEKSLNGIQKAMIGLGSALEVSKPPEDREEEVAASGLCETCANPCEKKAAGVSECEKHHEFVAHLCPRCYFWDVDTCQNGSPCVKGKGFIAKEDALPV